MDSSVFRPDDGRISAAGASDGAGGGGAVNEHVKEFPGEITRLKSSQG